MNRVLVYVPGTSGTLGAAIRWTLERDAAEELVSEGRHEKNSIYSGAMIVPQEQWPLHRYVMGEAGGPVQDPDSEPLTIAERKQYEAQLEHVDEADVETVGDMADKLNSMSNMLAQMQAQIDQGEKTILAKDKQLKDQQCAVDALGAKPAAKRTPKKAANTGK